MTTEAPSRPQPLYSSPWGLLPFQQDGVVRAYLGNLLAVWDTGLGKSHLGLAAGCLLFEDDLIDVYLLVCEQNKIEEWVKDFAEHTDLRVVPYGGEGQTAAHRKKIIEAVATGEPVQVKRGWTVERPQVLVGTYETFRNDLMEKVKTKNAKGRVVTSEVPGPLTQALFGRRVLIAYDEMTKVGNRGTGIHRAQALLLKHLAKTGGSARLIGLTATPIDRDPENHYNLGRLLCPDAVGTVASFEKDHVKYRDAYGRPTFKNLSAETRTEPWVTPLDEKMAGVLHRKRWTDPDVVSQFPEVSERFVHVRLGDRHRDFYDTIEAIAIERAVDRDDYRYFNLLRMVAGHPLALLHSTSDFAKEIVAEVGEDGLRALGAAKLDVLAERLKSIVLGQGAQATVFTFFGPSMIPLIAARLEDEGITVAQNYPDLGDRLRREHRAEFTEGTRRVFLSSDAGARGINLPQASYAFEYEAALTHSLRTQRLNRAKRLDSRQHGVDHVYFQTLIAKDTVEEPIADNVIRRNACADVLLGDDDSGALSAADRRRMLEASRRA